MKKQILSITTVLLFSIAAMGQSRHEISIHAAGGLSTLNYKFENGGDVKMGFGGTAGLGYNFFFTESFGLGTGVEVGLYNTKANLNGFVNSRNAVDMDGETYEARLRLNNFEEKQQAYFINIPLMLNFQAGQKHKFYAAAGAKLGIPIQAKYETADGAELISSGYYATENVEYTTQEFMGFGRIGGTKAEGDLDFKLACLLSVEAGVKWRLNDRLYLYTGAYFDYGVNDISKAHDDTFIDRQGMARTYSTSSVLTSNYNQYNASNNSVTTPQMVDKIRPMAVGLKIRLSFGMGSFGEDMVRITQVRQVNERPTRVRNADRQRRVEDAKVISSAESMRVTEAAKAAAYQEALAEMEKTIDGFELGSEQLDQTRKAMLDKKIAIMKQHPEINITLVGFTCDIGTDQVNMKQGLLRSEEAKKYMVNNGIAANRIQVTSDGVKNPVRPNTSEENRKKNRRVEVLVDTK